MKVDTLEELKAGFEAWRSTKRHKGEAIPSELRERTRRAVDAYGAGVVATATRLARSRLKAERGQPAPHGAGATAPTYSRMQFASATAVAERPLAEVETPTGLKVRLFADTPQAVGLVTSLLAIGGVR